MTCNIEMERARQRRNKRDARLAVQLWREEVELFEGKLKARRLQSNRRKVTGAR